MSSDRQLICSIRQGDSRAFEELFLKYSDRLFSFACALLGDADVAEDILQNVFLKLWIGRERLDEERSVSNYLLVSIRNEIYDWFYRKYNQVTVHRELPELEDNSGDIETRIIGDETSRMVDRLVMDMPPQRQKIFIMSRYRQMPTKEIARVLDLSERTVERHLYLALKDLKNILS